MPPATDKPAHGSAAEHDALPAGTRFGELEILHILGVGGFGMVYLARDHSLERDVALKEYMPSSLASRGEGAQVSVRSGGFAETYAVGLRSFVNEARLLAKFDHPSLVKVYRFWEANGTAYMVMPYLVGRTLRDARKAMGGRSPDEAWLRGVLDPILGALEVLHREGVYHRDIAPDNIWLQNDGPAILLDFGAARRVISDRTQSLTAILKPSYAPIEQYAEMSALRQGPWTDLYALGAVTHFLLAGAPPGPSTARALQDEMVPLWMRHYPGVSPRFLAAIDWALQVRPKERPQNVDELRAALDGRIEPPAIERHDAVRGASAPAPLAEAPTQFEPTRRVAGAGVATTFEPTLRVPPPPPPRPTQTQARPPATTASVTAAVAPTAVSAVSTVKTVAAPPAARTAPAPLVTSAPAPAPAAAAGMATGTRLLIAAAAVVLGLAAGAAVRYFGLFGGTPSDAVGAAPAVAPAPAATDAPPPAAAPVVALAVPAPQALPAAADTPAAAPAQEAAPAAEPRRPAAAPQEKPLAAATTITTPPAEATAPAEPAPAPPPAPKAPPRVAAATVPAVAPAAPALPAGPATAREACGKRVLFALASCLDRECQNPRFAQDADCVRLREQRRAREQQ